MTPSKKINLSVTCRKCLEVYAFYSRGVKGNWDVVAILKTLEQLNAIKDEFKRRFSILEMRTAIWTDVKEMNYNLTITSVMRKRKRESVNYQVKAQRSSPQSMILDQIDQEIADKLSENGRVSMETLGREIGISSDTAKRRYEKLKKNGVLKVTIQINPNKIGYQALCIFFTVTSHENSFAIIEKISRIPDVISIMKTTGDYDLQIYAMVKDLGQFLSVQEQLGKNSRHNKNGCRNIVVREIGKMAKPPSIYIYLLEGHIVGSSNPPKIL